MLLKLLVLGDSGVGKTRLVTRYAQGTPFEKPLSSTVAVDFYAKTVALYGRNTATGAFEDGKREASIQIWDTAGTEKYQSLSTTLFRGAHAALIVFSLTDPASFQHVPTWVRAVRTYSGDGIPLLIVGNKADRTDLRAVTAQEATACAAQLGALYVEASALTMENVALCFVRIAHLASGVEYDPLRVAASPATPGVAAATTGAGSGPATLTLPRRGGVVLTPPKAERRSRCAQC